MFFISSRRRHTRLQGDWSSDVCSSDLPVEYEYVKNPTGDGMVTTFADGKKMTLHREGFWKGSCGMRFEGKDGWVAAADGYKQPDVSNPALLADFDKIVKDYTERTGRPAGPAGTDGVVSHGRNFFDCVRSRKPTVANAEVMFHSMS